MALLERMVVPTGLMATAVGLRLRLDGLEHTVSPELLDRFAAGSATRGERRAVVLHLLEGCSSCSRHLGRYLSVENVQEPQGSYDQAFDRALERAFEALKLRQGAPQ